MKPKLKADVFWVPTADGVAFIHPAGMFMVKGSTALPLMDRLARYLDGSTELTTLVSGLPADKAGMVTTLVDALTQAQLVKDAGVDEPHGLTDDELTRFAAEIAYIDHFHPSAASTFERYRRATVVCIGAGLTVTTLAAAGLRSGLRRVTVLLTDECPTDLEQLRRTAAGLADQELFVRPIPDTEPVDWSGVLTDAELVLHTSDRPMLRRARDLDRCCARLGIPAAHAIVAADQAWIGPVGGAAGPGWESAWLRGSATAWRGAGRDPFHATPELQKNEFLAGPTAAIVASHLHLLGFRWLTEIDRPVTGAVTTIVDLETLHTVDHPVPEHPSAGPMIVEDDTGGLAELLEAAPIDPEDFSRAAVKLFNSRTGLCIELDEQDIPQLPLHAALAVVSDPFGLLDTRDGLPVVAGLGTDFTSARRTAAMNALTLYAALAVDQRVVASGRVNAYDLATGNATTVSTRLAFPMLQSAGAPARDVSVPIGLSAGFSTDQALTRGLLDHCRAIALDCGRVGGVLAPATLELGTTGRQYLTQVDLCRLPVRLAEVTNDIGVPTVAAYITGDTESAPIAFAAGLDLAEAATAVLELALRHYQGEQADRPELQTAPLPRLARDDDYAGGSAAPITGGWREITDRLAKLGYRVLALRAGHDQAAFGVLPVIQTVVCRDE